MARAFNHKHILGIDHLSAKELTLLLETSDRFKSLVGPPPIRKVPFLRNILVVMAFFEPSTRTRLSFETAAKRLTADTMSFTASTSSLVKGETLLDTCKNLEAMQPSVIIMRHKSSGAPHFVAENTGISVINAGDGYHEHPSQALLDLYTMREHKKEFNGLKVAILGDIAHSRVAHSNIIGLSKLGADVHLAGPATMIPKDVEKMGNVTVHRDIRDAVNQAEVVMLLRIQLERMDKTLFPSNREYFRFFGMDRDVLKLARKNHILMHPGPINRGVELAHELADGPSNVILEQVTNGVVVRMAMLYLVLGGSLEGEAVQ